MNRTMNLVLLSQLFFIQWSCFSVTQIDENCGGQSVTCCIDIRFVDSPEAIYHTSLKNDMEQYRIVTNILNDAIYYALFNQDLLGSKVCLAAVADRNTIHTFQDYEAACVYLKKYCKQSGYNEVVNVKYGLSHWDQSIYYKVPIIEEEEQFLNAVAMIIEDGLVIPVRSYEYVEYNTFERKLFEYVIFFMGLSALELNLHYQNEKYLPRLCLDYSLVQSENDLMTYTFYGNVIVKILDYLNTLTYTQKEELLHALYDNMMAAEKNSKIAHYESGNRVYE